MISHPRCLFISPIAPDPIGNGLAQRAFMFWRALRQVFETDVLLVPVAQPNPWLSLHQESTSKPVFEIIEGEFASSTHFNLIKRIGDPTERCASFSDYGLPSLCANLTDDLARLCAEALGTRQYQHVHAMRSYCAPFTKSLVNQICGTAEPKPTLTLDLDEDDARFADELALQQRLKGDIHNADWTACEARAFKTIIHENVATFDRVFASSGKEARLLSQQTDVQLETAVNAVAVPTNPKSLRTGKGLLFVGSFQHLPNADGLEWFIQEIWPKVHSRTDTELTIIGQAPPSRIQKLAHGPGLNLLSNVIDLRPFYERAVVSVVPLRLGAGTRIKILESAAYGVPVVATTVGADGLDFEDGVHGWIADTPEGFASAICEALVQPMQCEQRADNAWRLVHRFHNIHREIDRLSGIFSQFRYCTKN